MAAIRRSSVATGLPVAVALCAVLFSAAGRMTTAAELPTVSPTPTSARLSTGGDRLPPIVDTTAKAFTKPRSTKRPAEQIAQSRPTPQQKPTDLPPSAFRSLPGGCRQTTGSERLSQQHVDVLMDQLALLLKRFLGTDALGQSNHPLVAGSVRLAFHACVGDSCGGCINVNNPANNGLNITINALTAFRDQLLRVPQFADCALSYADLWQAAATAALKTAVFDRATAQVCSVQVLFGRTDCPTAPYTDEMLAYPDRRWSIDPLLAFAARLGLTAEQFVSLMGMHSLGVVRDFDGRVMAQWDRSTDSFVDGSYFTAVANQAKAWTAVPLKYASQSTPVMYAFSKDLPANRMIMLTSDFSLAYNITTRDPDATAQPTASLVSCPFSSTYSYVAHFAKNATAWQQVFCGAWSTLTTRGYASGSLLPAAAAVGRTV